MPGFPLTPFHSTLLEKIVTKLKKKSYFRIQQTCRGMEELIRSNRNISVCVGENATLSYYMEKGAMIIEIDTYNKGSLDIQSLYGEQYEIQCKELSKYRITCNFLCVDFYWSPNKNQSIELMKILKPVHVAMNTREEPNRYKALLTWKGLEQISLEVTPENIFPPLKMFAPLFPKMSMIAEGVLENQSIELMKIRDFLFGLECREELPPVEKQLERLRDYHLEMDYIVRCRFGREGAPFMLSMSGTCIRVIYRPVVGLNGVH